MQKYRVIMKSGNGFVISQSAFDQIKKGSTAISASGTGATLIAHDECVINIQEVSHIIPIAEPK